MQYVPEAKAVGPAVLDHICDQFALEADRYVARIDAHRAVMQKYARYRSHALGPEHTAPLESLMRETTALMELCVDMAGVQSAMLARQAKSIRLVAGLMGRSDTLTEA